MADDVEVVPQDAAEGQAEGVADERSAVHEPGKLLRIAVMLREMQEEVRRAPTDDAGRERLRTVHDRAVAQLCDALSGDLREELNTLTMPFEGETPSDSEILIAQAQLIGWLEGLFQGIQAAIVNQQLQARQQLDQMRRGLPQGMPAQGPGPGPGPGLPGAPGTDRPSPGQYL